MKTEKMNRSVKLFALVVIFSALANGLSGNIMSNYFKDAFNVTALQRGFLETPRESGGVLCAVIFLIAGFLGDTTLGIAAQAMMAAGLFVMAFFHPSYTAMIIFLVIYSTGQHLFMPLNDSIAMSLAEDNKSGTILGRFKKYNDYTAMLIGAIVFICFKLNIFSFKVHTIIPFALACGCSVLATIFVAILRKDLKHKEVKNQSIALKKEYLPYYITTFAYGCQKRIRLVFAPWILIELLSQGAETTALLTIIFKLFSGYIAPRFGKFIDRRGVRTAMYVEAAVLALIFCINGVIAAAIVSGGFTGPFWVGLAGLGYVLSWFTDQFNTVHAVMMKKLAGEHKEDITANLSMGVTVDHIMAIVVSPILGYIWIRFGPPYVFYVTALTAICQALVAKYMLRDI